jgi:putative membrane protein
VIGAAAAAWGPNRLAPRILIAALLLVLIDGVLDPGATALGFWTWTEAARTTASPWSTPRLAPLRHRLRRPAPLHRPRHTPPPPGALDSAVLSLAFWTGVAVFSGLAFPAALGLVLFALSLARRSHLKAASK